MNKPLKVLIVEDSEGDAKLVLRVLQRGGFEPTYQRVQTAAELETALAQEHWDAIISDFRMPGFTGMDGLRIFRSTGLDIPFILISGAIGEESAVNAMKPGASDYVTKNSPARFASALERELNETRMRAAHRRAQESLMDSEEKFRQMAENIRDVFFLLDADGNRMVYISPAYEEIWSRSCESLYANPESWTEAIHPEDRASTYGKYKQGLLEGKATFEFRIVRAEGSIRWIEVRCFPVRNDASKFVRIAGVAKDITERKQAEQALRTSEERFKTMFVQAPFGIALIDPLAGHIYEVNPRFAEIAGRSMEEMANIDWLQITHPDDVQADLENMALLNAGKINGFQMEKRYRHPDGTIVWIDMTITPFKVEDKTHPRHLCMIRDITERKDTEKNLVQMEGRYRGLLEAAPDAMVVVNQGGEIVLLNLQAEKQFGYRRDELVGQKVKNIVPEGFAERLVADGLRSAADALAQQIGTGIELTGRRKDGSEFPIEIMLSPLESAEGILVTAAIRDITERKDAEKNLVQMEGRYRGLLEAAPDAMVVVNQGGEIVLLNLQAEKQFGYRRDELVGQKVKNIIPEGFAERLVADGLRSAADALAQQIGTGIELTGRRKDGSEFPIEIMLSPLESDEGILVTAAIRDITERKDAEKNLVQMEGRYRGLLEAAPDAMVVVNQDGEIVLLNLQAEKQFGYRRDELVGQKVKNIIPEGFAERLVADGLRSAADALAQQIGTGIELTGRRKDGSEFPIEIMLSPLESADGILVTAAIRDITERKIAQYRIVHLNRVYAILSGINTLIVHVRDRDELFREACRIAVEAGGFRMALIAIVDRSAMKIVPVAWAGMDEKLLASIKGILSSSESAPKTMLARAIREKNIVVSNDPQSDPRVFFSKKYTESGICSMAVFPLIVSDEAKGVLSLYASESEFFQEEELKLLTELAGDIAFAIDHIDKQERLNYLAYYDVLTGLANRSLFLDRVAQYMHSAVSGGHKLALFLIDLERFKNINDSLGRPAGDELLRLVAEWLTHNAGDANLLARLDADHFAVVLPEVKQEGDVARFLENTMAAFRRHPFRLNDAVFSITAKAGIALFPDDGDNTDTLYKHAEAALKKAKASGDRYLFYTQKMTESVAGKLSLENQLRQALDNGEFVLYYQPKVNLQSGKITSAEALIRWNDPRTGLMPPGRFIPILEETGLIYEVGRWALRKAIEDYLRWRAAGLAAVRIAVNVSPLQLLNPGFIAEIKQAIGIDAHAAAGLELEITESLLMEDVKLSIASLKAIRAMGISIAIDDFGTGFSSLSYLSKLPVDTLKIDRSFVIDMTTGPQGLALVSTIINLAHSLNLKVVAEGVETEEQSRLLRLLNCDEMQGFLFSKPVPGEIFETRYLTLPSAG